MAGCPVKNDHQKNFFSSFTQTEALLRTNKIDISFHQGYMSETVPLTLAA
jgi:hypothetical protein